MKQKQTKIDTVKIVRAFSALVIAGLFAASCSKSSNSSATPPVVNGAVPVIIDPGTVSGTTITYGSGSTSTFTPVSLATMNKYVATHPLNNPTNFRINVNLTQASQGRYGGKVSISYLDNGINYNGEFNAGLGVNQNVKGLYDNGVLESQYNFWFHFDNKLVFSGFFEDQYGAITITLVPQNSTTTGSGNDAEPVITGPYKGYVYFKNFQNTFAGHSPYRSCWFVYTGPYDCRSNVISSKGGYFPGPEAGYELLGTFSDVNINAAFNIN
jgi:hypothetical protein